MSEEERFKRSEVGHDANDLHKHGGLDAHDEEKTEREDLEDAIEALEDSEESEDLEEIEKDIKDEESEEEAEEEPEEKPEAEEEPQNDWKEKEENKPYMTIDEVREPKKEKKGGAGWKVATILFALLAIAGCGTAAYLFFNNGKVEFLGRRVTSEKSEKSENAITEPVKAPDDTPIADNNNNGRLIYLDGYDLALKIPDTLTNVSYEYYQNNEGGCPECTWSSNYSTLELNAAYKNGAISAAPFASQTEDDMYPMGAITITSGKPNYEASAPELVTTIETNDPDIKYSIYYNHPQQGFCNGKYADCAKWESQSVAEIEKMLMNKDNYIKLSK